VFYVPVDKGKRVEPGMSIQLAPNGVDVSQTGSLLGVVKQVSQYPISAEGVKKGLGSDQLAQHVISKGGGAMVEVRFERAERNDGQKAAVPPICLDRRQILVCEDNELNREIVTTLLEMNNLQVIQAENGEQGVQRFIESPEYSIEAILMDIRMPVMDGLTAAAKIRQLARRDAAMVPIIALSANAFQEDVEDSRRAGMNDHLTKPIEPDLLLNCLQRQIGNYEVQRRGSDDGAET